MPFRQSLVSPVDMTEIETRLDRQLSANHTLVGRFFTEKRNMDNMGLDTFTLPRWPSTRENTRNCAAADRDRDDRSLRRERDPFSV